MKKPSLDQRLSRLFILAGLFIFSAAGWLRLSDTLTDWLWLEFAGIQPGPIYLVISGALWGIAAAVGLVWILMQWRYYRLVGMGAALLIAISYWADRLLINTNSHAGYNSLFAVVLTLFGLAWIFSDLYPEKTSLKRKRELRGAHDNK